MKNKVKQAVNTAKTSTLENFTSLSRKQLQSITGGGDPTLSRGTKTSAAD